MDGEKIGDSTIIVTEILPPYGRLNDKKTGLDALANASRHTEKFVKEFSSKHQRLFQKVLHLFKKVLSSISAIISSLFSAFFDDGSPFLVDGRSQSNHHL